MFLRRGDIIEDGFERGNDLYHIILHEVEFHGGAKVMHRQQNQLFLQR